MAGLVGIYNLKLVQVSIGAFRVTGWGDDDACAITPMADLQDSQVSADGSHVAYSKISDNRYEVKLTVRRTSLAFKRLGELMQEQMDDRDAGTVNHLAFQLYDPVTGDKVVERSAQFMRAPDLTNGVKAGTAEFKLQLPSPDITYGANIT